jgi:hypothetical protein
MSYEVRCECGKAHAVGTTDAGSSLHCPCGRDVEVPALHVLRASAGEFGVAPDLLLQGMILKKQLPDTDRCAACGEPTDGEVVAVVNCETAVEKTEKATPSGCMPIGFGFIVFYHPARKKERGRDVWFRVPVRCCPACADGLTHDGLRPLLRQNRVVAGVLDKYPHARVTRSN